MATLMTFLYMVHPPKQLENNVRQKLKGVSFGGASVISRDFDTFFGDTLTTVICGSDVIPRLSFSAV